MFGCSQLRSFSMFVCWCHIILTSRRQAMAHCTRITSLLFASGSLCHWRIELWLVHLRVPRWVGCLSHCALVKLTGIICNSMSQAVACHQLQSLEGFDDWAATEWSLDSSRLTSLVCCTSVCCISIQPSADALHIRSGGTSIACYTTRPACHSSCQQH